MFDRIAGVYDLMNSVMTAGLHHRWRQRAADLAALGPGTAARRGHRHRRPRAGAERPRGREVVGARLLRGMLEPRACEGARRRFEYGNALALPYADARSTPPPSASAPATSPTWPRACARWRASCGRADAWSSGDHHAPAAAAVVVLPLWFDRVVPPRPRRGRPRRLHLPAQLGAPLSRRPGPRRGDGRGRAERRALDPDRRRDHRDPRRRPVGGERRRSRAGGDARGRRRRAAR